MEKQERKREKENKIKKPKREVLKRNIAFETSGIPNGPEAGPSQKKTRKVIKPKPVVKKAAKKTKKVASDDSDTDHGFDDEDLCSDDELDDILEEGTLYCFICRENDTEDGLLWKCGGCHQWAHHLCSEGRPSDDLCELCKSFK